MTRLWVNWPPPAPEGVGILADMLVPASQGENAAVEYALNGVASFVTAAGREQLRPAVCEGLLAALARCKDDANRAFLVSQLQLCATADNAATLAAYIDDPYLGDPVLRALISIPDSEATLLSLARRSDLSDAQRAALAYAFGEKRTAAAEPILLGWIDGADDATRAALYPALASCGTAASAKALEAAARAVDYGCDETAATDSYLRLLDRMVDEGAARDAVKAAKRLLKCERANVRGAALEVIVRAEGTRAMPYVLAALEKGDIQYRNAALRYIGDKADDAVYAAIAADRKRLSDEAWADVIEWFGVRHAASQTGAVTEAVGSSNDAVALAGIRAAGRLGGDEALAALIAALGGPALRRRGTDAAGLQRPYRRRRRQGTRRPRHDAGTGAQPRCRTAYRCRRGQGLRPARRTGRRRLGGRLPCAGQHRRSRRRRPPEPAARHRRRGTCRAALGCAHPCRTHART